ncbi:hypothetical protein HanIR_Chr13g0660131 [Helianthus annuus]|nr:hypothetical protein HanIR_Chr13g0660131 [Helianthus annuus]
MVRPNLVGLGRGMEVAMWSRKSLASRVVASVGKRKGSRCCEQGGGWIGLGYWSRTQHQIGSESDPYYHRAGSC